MISAAGDFVASPPGVLHQFVNESEVPVAVGLAAFGAAWFLASATLCGHTQKVVKRVVERAKAVGRGARSSII